MVLFGIYVMENPFFNILHFYAEVTISMYKSEAKWVSRFKFDGSWWSSAYKWPRGSISFELREHRFSMIGPHNSVLIYCCLETVSINNQAPMKWWTFFNLICSTDTIIMTGCINQINIKHVGTYHLYPIADPEIK